MYRDEWAMKRAAVRAGIQVAHHALLRSAADLDSFVDRHGLPVVAEPRRGALSVGVSVLRTREELDGWLRTAGPTGPAGERLAGQPLFTKRPGVLRSLPDPATLPEGVVKYTTYAEVGETVPDASYSGDFLAAFVTTGADRAETEARIRATESWFRAGLDIG
ncbi:hypothetical protein [Streptomyces sp. NWU49]|uniref:hypothetical protein n=1 Tax=Streptomyces sp. NWU49 TaxID=2201153 RepID=UPI00215A2121|nr:hypothetical protein [Streptomyces sp. NWU49]